MSKIGLGETELLDPPFTTDGVLRVVQIGQVVGVMRR